MPDKPIKTPGPDHPIAINANSSRIVVSFKGTIIADSHDALTLREASYPPVHYIPKADVEMTFLQSSDNVTYCPYKGTCSYFNVASGGANMTNAVWSYKHPHDAVMAIKDYLAFYPDRFEITER